MPAPPIDDVLQRLKAFYGPLALPPRDPFACFVWETMSPHAAPHKRDAALAALRRIPALTPDSIWKTPLAKLEAAVALAGPFQDERIRSLRLGSDLFRRDPGLARALNGSLLAARRAVGRLTTLSQAGRWRLLLFAADRAIVPVDPATARVGVRLGFGADRPSQRGLVRSVRLALSRALPPDIDARRRAIALLEHHGASTCAEFDPHCQVCPLAEVCPSAHAARQLPPDP